MQYFSFRLLALTLSSLALMSAQAASLEDFNVYAIRGIEYGGARASQGSDIQGVVGSAGNITLKNMAIGQSASSTRFSLISGGFAWLSDAGIYKGGIEANYGVEIAFASVRGDISTGGDFVGRNGYNEGKIWAAGQIETSRTWGYSSRSRVHFRSNTDHDDVIRQMMTWSQRLEQLPQGQEFQKSDLGEYACVAQEGDAFTVCEADASLLDGAGEIFFLGQRNHTFVVTIKGQTVYFGGKPNGARAKGAKLTFMDSKTKFEYRPDNAAKTLIWNMPQASQIFLDRMALWGTVLAPQAVFKSTKDTRMIGRIYVDELIGNGQINLRCFDEPQPNGLCRNDMGSGK